MFFQSQIIEALGATVERVRPVSITHKDHYVNVARRRALEATNRAAIPREADKIKGIDLLQMNGHAPKQTEGHPCSADNKGGFFADQFENLANFRAHYEWTGPEIWEQTQGKLHAFVAAAGTGGTIAGISQFIKVHHCTLYFMLYLMLCSFFYPSTILMSSYPGKKSKY